MKKIIALGMVLAFVMSFLAVPAFAAVPQTGKGIVDAGNKLCPVSGDPVSGKNFVVYKGVRYGLCCPACKKPFLKDPKKYLAAMQQGKPTADTKMGVMIPVPSDAKKTT